MHLNFYLLPIFGALSVAAFQAEVKPSVTVDAPHKKIDEGHRRWNPLIDHFDSEGSLWDELGKASRERKENMGPTKMDPCMSPDLLRTADSSLQRQTQEMLAYLPEERTWRSIAHPSLLRLDNHKIAEFLSAERMWRHTPKGYVLAPEAPTTFNKLSVKDWAWRLKKFVHPSKKNGVLPAAFSGEERMWRKIDKHQLRTHPKYSDMGVYTDHERTWRFPTKSQVIHGDHEAMKALKLRENDWEQLSHEMDITQKRQKKRKSTAGAHGSADKLGFPVSDFESEEREWKPIGAVNPRHHFNPDGEDLPLGP